MAANRSQRISTEMMRKFQLIDALSKYNKPSATDLHDVTGIPVSTVKRQIRLLREEFGMRILFIRDPGGQRGNTGYYMLADWGILDRDAFIQHYKRLKQQQRPKIRPVVCSS